jgi:DNA-binding response OmpR family regulator
MKVFLQNAGFDVYAFETGDLLLTAFENKPADLVILDVMMPGSSGLNVCKELRKFSHVPVIMLSARDSDIDYQTAMDLGSDDYFTKPSSPMTIVSRVKAIFRRIRFEREAYEKELKQLGGN